MTHHAKQRTSLFSTTDHPKEKRRFSARFGAGAPLLMAMVLLTPMLLGGCKKKATLTGRNTNVQDSAPTTRQPTRPARLQPEDLNLAAGVQFPANMIPDDEQAARAIATFASALSTGDSDALASMLDRSDAAVLERLVSTGGWDTGAEAIKVVRVCTIQEDAGSFLLGLGVEDNHGAYLLGWAGALEGDGWKFSALPIVSPPASKASDLDGVAMTNLNIPEPGPVVAETAPARAPVDDQKKRSSGRRRQRRPTLGPG